MNKAVLKCALMATASIALMPEMINAQTTPEQVAAEPAAGTTDGDIVVSALRRNQRIQDVPAAVSAISGDTLAQMGAKSYTDYLRSIPNVSFNENGFRRSSFIIRGVSAGASQNDSTTAIYVDEAPITEGLVSSADLNLFDLQRVEVLRGPQGTLYGASSMGGTIRFILNKAQSDKIEAVAAADLSATDNGGTNYSANAMVNIPIVDGKLALRVVGGYRNDNGFIDDPAHSRHNINGMTQKNARASLVVDAAPNVKIELGALYQKDDYDGQPQVDRTAPDYDQSRRAPEYSTRETQIYSATIRADLGWANLISATNYFNKKQLFVTDNTPSFASTAAGAIGAPFDSASGLLLATQVQQRSLTQEIRLASAGTGRFGWLVGGFYSDGRRDTNQYFDNSYSPQVANINLYTQHNRVNQRQLAGFGELSYELLRGLTATAGIRVFQYDQDNSGVSSGVLNGPGITNSVSGAHGNSATKKFLINYDLDRNHKLYATASQGFRNGVPGGTLPSTCDAELASIGRANSAAGAKPDTLWNYEVGSKNSFFGGKATLNAAAFYIDWKNIQLTRTLPVCGFSFTDNFGKATSKGFELETSIRPVAGLDLTGSLGYTDAKLKTGVPSLGASPNDPVPYVPKWTYAASADYSFARLANGEVFVRADYQHSSSQLTGFSLLASTVRLDPITTINLRTGLRTGRWDLALYVTNVANRRNETFYTASPYQAYSVNRPRTIGLSGMLRY